jgi:transposase
MKFIGIDLHTNCFTACSLDYDGKKSIVTFKLDSDGIEQFLKIVDLESYILVEATINSFCFVNLIKSNVKEVIVANTFELKTISFTNKN